MIKYAKVRTVNGIRYMRIEKQEGSRLSGYRVTKDGDKWSKQIDHQTMQIELIIVQLGDVIKYMKMDNMYGILVDL